MRIKLLLIIGLVSLMTSRSQAQVGAPSLAIGAGEVLYGKGDLDAELILSMISSKTDEVKLAFVERYVTQQLAKANSSYTFQRFVNKNLDILFNETDADIIKKDLLYNSAEMMFVFAATEGFLRAHNKDSLDAHVSNLGTYVSGRTGNMFALTHLNKTKKIRLQTVASRPEHVEVPLGNYLLDVILEVCVSHEGMNTELSKLGLFNKGDESEMIQEFSLVSSYEIADPVHDKKWVEAFRNDFIKHTEQLLRWKTLIRYVNNSKIFTGDSLSTTIMADISNKIDGLKDGIGALVNNWKWEGKESNPLTENDRDIILGLMKRLVQNGIDKSLLNKNLDGWFYQINDVMIPYVFELSTRIGNDKLDDFYMELGEVRDFIAKKFKSSCTEDLNMSELLDLLDIITNLDDVKSYDRLFKKLSQISAIIDVDGSNNPKLARVTKTVLDLVATAYDKYAIIDEESNKMNIDVSSMTFDFYKKFAEGNGTNPSAYYTVGANYMVSNLFNSDGELELKNLTTTGFVSEKLGIKWKIFDNERRTSFGLYEDINRKQLRKLQDDPILSDIHLIGYGSGLLYNMKFLNTDSIPKGFLLGTGLGITFFNGLDLNFNYAYRLGTDLPVRQRQTFTVSFDVAFGEYLSELRKKQQAKKFMEENR